MNRHVAAVDMAMANTFFTTCFVSLTFWATTEQHQTEENAPFEGAPLKIRNFARQLPFPEPDLSDNRYDFIIVGSGSAGGIIATRLSEISNFRVLLLEAGTPERVFTWVPATVASLRYSRYDWHYLMEPQSNVGWGLEKGRMSCPRGKALGGSTVVNYMIYSRGNPVDYDIWESHGNYGWGYRDVLSYFMKSENASLRRADNRFHGHEGPVHVEDAFSTTMTDVFVEAGGEMGYQRYVDYNSDHQLGFSPMQSLTQRGRRHSVARAYLYPARHRRNLHIVTHAHVTRILIEPKSKRAYGVEYYYKKEDGLRLAYARKEIILSAGVINTPQILMLSGIGPRHHLSNLGIITHSDLPVGDNLRDHVFFFGLKFLPKVTLSLNLRKVLNPEALRTYLETGTGPYSTLGGFEGIAFIKTNQTGESLLPFQEYQQQPDIELVPGNGLTLDRGFLVRHTVRINDHTYNNHFSHLEGKPMFQILPVVLHPKSKGKIRLRSQNPFTPPLIYGNYFNDPENHDMATMIAGIRFVVDMVNTKAFQEYDIRLDKMAAPGCERHRYDSDAYWDCAVRTLSHTYFHHMGTCKMGPDGDPSAVVDPELRVRGISRLRVADSSIFPVTLSSHLQAPTMMVGEKAADLIKQTWRDYAHY